MMFASGVSASASNATEVITHSYVKRELSDASYNRLAIVHASGTYHFVGCRNDADLSLGSIGSPRFEDYHRKVVMGTCRTSRVLRVRFFGLGCIIAAFALGVILNGPRHHFRAGHRRTGLVLLILVVVQSILGVALKLLSKTRAQKDGRMPGVKRHPIQNIFHIFMGVLFLYNYAKSGNGGTTHTFSKDKRRFGPEQWISLKAMMLQQPECLQ
ncbi:hypothetical protein QFC20_004487 [Naganishia adeliensis]|uniref:Uncharacterized protein n=1 Tax=Naganishia adeliensis TaxID=92952 RepID=A0ACC2W0R1_9TREE|nr:hypothetical protein QFC20_004487 [Naganishia adeliensis]